MSIINKPYIVIASLFISISSCAAANDLARQKDALDVISALADKICSLPPLSGQENQLELSGKGKVELNKVLKKIADLGIQGGAAYQHKKYEGVLQKDIASLLINSTDCRLEVLRELKDKLLTKENSINSLADKKTNEQTRDSAKRNLPVRSVKFPLVSKLLLGQKKKFFDGLEITTGNYFGLDERELVEIYSPALGETKFDIFVGEEGPTVSVNGVDYQILLLAFDSKTSLVTVKVDKLGRAQIVPAKN